VLAAFEIYAEAVRAGGEVWFEQRVVRPANVLPRAQHDTKLIFGAGGTCHIQVGVAKHRSGVTVNDADAPVIARPRAGQSLRPAGQQVRVTGTDCPGVLARDWARHRSTSGDQPHGSVSQIRLRPQLRRTDPDGARGQPKQPVEVTDGHREVGDDLGMPARGQPDSRNVFFKGTGAK
jgi:hypothetical protein